MFSWSTTRRSSATSATSTSSYPAAAVVISASAQQGSASSSGYSRQQQLDSYLRDPTLSKSTRRVSKGKYKCVMGIVRYQILCLIVGFYSSFRLKSLIIPFFLVCEADDTTYDTVFQTVSGNALILRVHVPPRVGAVPAMNLVGVRASHPWLDSNMRVIGYPALSSDEHWRSSNMLLGGGVNEVVKHLQLNPPTILQITDKSLERLQQQNTSSSLTSGQHIRFPSYPPQHEGVYVPSEFREQSTTKTSDTFFIPIPEVPSSFPEVDNMTKKEVETLLNDETAFKTFVKNLSAVTAIEEFHDVLSEGNFETAKANLAHEEELRALHADVKSLKSDLNQKIEAFSSLERAYLEFCGPLDPRRVLKKLHVAKREAFTESEKLGSSWLEDKDMSVDDFVNGFIEKRQVYHTRAAKIERLSSTS